MSRRAERFEAAGAQLLQETGVTVRRWRSRNTGAADVRSEKWEIEAPRPRGPISFATFAHEIGHQMLHRNGRRARWLEEVEAWEYALAQFERFDLPGVELARADAAEALAYAAAKAERRTKNPETARRILDRYPPWVWAAEIDRSAVAHLDR